MKFSLQPLTRQKIIIFSTIVVFILIGIAVTVYVALQRQEPRKKALEVGENALVCDPGPDPYDSTSIIVTNNTSETIERLVSNVFRCRYVPNKIRKGYFFCDNTCNEATNPDCLNGTWDAAASTITSIAPGETKTFTMTVNPCEIAQIDTYNEVEHVEDSLLECTNLRSQYTVPAGSRFPGGFGFAIDENSTGYDAATGTCPAPTATPTSEPTVTPTATVTPTETPPPTEETPTSTPVATPTSEPTATPTPVLIVEVNTPTPPPGSTPTSTPVPPVSGGLLPTILTILGGAAIVLIGFAL